ncbi:MAG: tetratricopeptide repeat protein, partial [Thermoanaerobaculia bacterium]|nr:tetratricopeptide repeat protein [Thermoanaerobaculia bacterium]
PARPSAVLSASDDPTQQAVLRSTTVERLRRRIRGDLELIVTKALQPATERRYPTAEAMADDLERSLLRLPIRARPPSMGYRLRRFVGRHRLAVVAGGVVLASLLVGLGGALWQGRIARREATTARAVVDLLVETFRSGDPATGGSTEATARELLARGIERLDTELGEQPRVRAELRTVLAEISVNLGDAQRGLELATAALADQGAGRFDLASQARAKRAVGTAQTALGDFVAAESTLREALALYQRARPRMLAEEAEVLDRLAIVLQSLGRPAEALPLVEEGLAHRTLLSEDSAAVIDSMNNLAVLRREAGDLDGAISLHREVLARRRRLLAEDHPSITDSLNNLGAALFHGGHLEEAAAFQEESLTRSRTSWGDAHPQVARARNNLAVTLREMGYLDRAEPQVLEVLEFWQNQGSAEHPHAVGAEFNLAKIAALRGDLGGARSTFDRVVSSWEVSLGSAHPNLAVALLERTGIKRQEGDLEGAAGDLERAGTILDQALTAPHQYLAAAMAANGELASARGDHAAALAAHRGALAMREQLYGTHHGVTLSSSVAVAALLAEDEPATAGAELRTALAMARELLPPTAPTLTAIELQAGETLCRLGDLDAALTALRAAAAGRAEAIGADRWPAWEARALEVECLETHGRSAAAEALGPVPADLPAPVALRWSAHPR